MPKLSEKTIRARAWRFLSLYYKYGMDASKAYKEAYRTNDKTALECGSRKYKSLIDSGLVREYLAEGELSAEWVVAQIRLCVHEASKISDRLNALQLLGKTLGLFRDVQELDDRRTNKMSDKELEEALRKCLQETHL